MSERAMSIRREQIGASAASGSLEPTRVLAVSAALILVVVIFRPYTGIVGDSVLYMGGASAGLDPDGIGRDPMWSLDGQMRFSIFPWLARSLVGWVGVVTAALTLSALGLLLWAAAVVAFAWVVAGRGAMIAVVLACATFPAVYNSHATVYFGEPIATPRVFAEAAVLAALAAAIGGRWRAAALFLAVGTLLHPIMALAGVGTIFVYLCLENRRLLWFGAVAAGLCLGGGLLGVPVLDRLTSPIDPEWLAMLRGPDDYLFLSTWPESAWSLKLVQASTVALGALVARGALRRFFVAVLVTSLAAMAAAFILGDLFPLLLIVQMQPWRVAWLLALAAAVAFAVCGVALWKEGPQSRFGLALLAMAWIVDASGVGAALAVSVVAMRRFRLEPPIGGNMVKWIWVGVVGLALLAIALNYGLAISFSASQPPGVLPPPMWLLLDGHVFAVPAALLGIYLVLHPPARPALGVLLSIDVALCILAWMFWRQEWDPYREAIAKAGRQDELIRLIDSRPGPILWLSGNQETWYWAGRPNWVSGMQGMAIVFSRELTMKWFERMRVLIELGWIADGGTIPRTISKPDPPFPDLSPGKIRAFCTRPDAPAWVVAPIPSADAGNGASVWRAPARHYVADPAGGPRVGLEYFAVLPCAPLV